MKVGDSIYVSGQAEFEAPESGVEVAVPFALVAPVNIVEGRTPLDLINSLIKAVIDDNGFPINAKVYFLSIVNLNNL